MNKKTLLILLPILTCSACTVKMPWENIILDEEGTELIMDNKFMNGFLANAGGETFQKYYPPGYDGTPTGPQPEIVKETPSGRITTDVELKYGVNNIAPSWTLRQNNDVYSLNDIYFDKNNRPNVIDGYYVFSDTSKVLGVKPGDGKLYMELNASQEYWRNRNSLDTWMHMLIASSFTEEANIAKVDSLIFNLDVQLKKYEDKTLDGYADTHCGQFLMYIQTKSISPKETSDRTFWFGVPLYDNTQPYAKDMLESGNADFAVGMNTGGFIYKMAGEDIYGDPNVTLEDKELHHINIDLKKYFSRAIDLAHNYEKDGKASPFWPFTTVDDLVITDMNLGYELPGRVDIGIEISNLSLKAVFKQ